MHQWVKNLLIFVPLVTSHRAAELPLLWKAGIAFLGLSLTASACYLINDILDIAVDRAHSIKQRRPFASGELRAHAGWAAAGTLLATGFAVGYLASAEVTFLLIVYAIVSISYSGFFKHQLLVDVFVLSGLYTLRLLIGGVAEGIELSGWLLCFSTFIFLSLGFSKRFAELRRLRAESGESARGYNAGDLEQINIFGVSSGFISALVLALYLNSDQMRILYRSGSVLWLLVPLFLYWVARLWMIASRGELNEDPIIFAVRDPVTYALGALSLLIIYAGTLDLDWLAVW